MKYRSRVEIVALMLEAAIRGATTTRLMYSSFMSNQQVRDYLIVLMTNGLVAREADGKTFKTTAKGVDFLNRSRRLFEILPPITTNN